MSACSGPENGSLVIVGGGASSDITERFVLQAGGILSKFLFVPTASGQEEHGPKMQGSFFERFTDAGVTDMQILHARDRTEADSESFAEQITAAQGVWFHGGRHTFLADRYLGTKAETAFHEVLARGGCIGGSSAGATIQGSYMVRGDTRGNMVMMGDHDTGFGFLKDVVIDQHLLKRNRQFDLVDVVRAKPELLGIGIDEETAIVVEGDRFSVIGRSYVAIYDAERMGNRGRFYYLSAGDTFDLKTRTAMRPSRERETLWLPHLMDAVEVEADRLQAYVGRYVSAEMAVDVQVEGRSLVVRRPEANQIDLVCLGGHTFAGEGWGEQVVFSVGEAGVEGMTLKGTDGRMGTATFKKA